MGGPERVLISEKQCRQRARAARPLSRGTVPALGQRGALAHPDLSFSFPLVPPSLQLRALWQSPIYKDD